MAPKHLVRQFKSAIESALASSQETRALMRARSSVQRFPVAQWIQDLETLQSKSIKVHQQVARGSVLSLQLPKTGFSTPGRSAMTPSTALSTAASSRAQSLERGRRLPLYNSETLPPTPGSGSPMPSVPVTALSTAAPSRAPSPERRQTSSRHSSGTITPVTGRVAYKNSLSNMLGLRLMALAEVESRSATIDGVVAEKGDDEARRGRQSATSEDSQSSGSATARGLEETLNKNISTLTIDTVAAGRKDFRLQNVDPFFNDPSGRYYSTFEKQLDDNMGNLSSDKLCVEDYLKTSEKDWFGKFHEAKMGKTSSKRSSASETLQEFPLGHGYVPPRLVRKWFQFKVGDWPIYSFLLAFGQIIAANSCKSLLPRRLPT